MSPLGAGTVIAAFLNEQSEAEGGDSDELCLCIVSNFLHKYCHVWTECANVKPLRPI